ncbi:unnamed protein product [Miscanthus lutarioriparius]|uniref:Uncharacterized protein n=1 Tax=Miscanthus lutarioriparius TaxID=422564 RepID=A0A811NJH6_9POAL|nr:unnamed protein product [Miscanthus lutarioriparius]
MAIDLNTLPEERGEEVPDLNKNPAEHERHEEDRDPLEDVVAAVQVGEADHFGVYPAKNDEQVDGGWHKRISAEGSRRRVGATRGCGWGQRNSRRGWG